MRIRALPLVLLHAGALPAGVFAQSDSLATVRVAVRHEAGPLPEATVSAAGRSQLSDREGRAFLRVPAGAWTVVAARPGWRPDSARVALRAGQDTALVLTLEMEEELEEIVVMTTRVERRLEDEPMRVEVLGGPDIAEKAQMRPSDLTRLVSEMSGVRIQPTAPGRGGAAVRIQGLRGQYTQILSDGLPLSGLSSDGLSLMQMPPLDIRQAEVIKGAATALYGPSALGGVLNLVSRRPDNSNEAMVNASTGGGQDGFLYLSRRFSDQFGATLIAGAHHQTARDVDGDGWANFPGFRRLELRPRVFYDRGGTSVLGTVGLMAEDRTGGTVGTALAPDGRPWPLDVNTRRGDAGLIARIPVGRWRLGLRASAGTTGRERVIGDAGEHDRRTALFGEATLSRSSGDWDWLVGTAWDRLDYANDSVPVHDFRYTVPGVFAQVTWTPVRLVGATLSGRCDDHSRFGTLCSPRLSLLVRPNDDLSVRASAGRGFGAPTVFVEETEDVRLAAVDPLGTFIGSERLENLALDVTWTRGPWEVNATAYTSRLRDAAVYVPPPGPVSGPLGSFQVRPGPSYTTGAELFAVYDALPFVITAWYAYLYGTEVDPVSGSRAEAPRNPRHTVFFDVGWEGTPGTWVALEAGWAGTQRLDDDPYRTHSQPHWIIELLAARKFGRTWLFANADNAGNVRQTRWSPLLLGARRLDGRWTVPQWAPLEGFTLNGGARVEF